jgi:hypothetical protein
LPLNVAANLEKYLTGHPNRQNSSVNSTLSPASDKIQISCCPTIEYFEEEDIWFKLQLKDIHLVS